VAESVDADSRINELDRAQQQLRASEELYRYVVELSSLIPWTADGRGNILTVGARWTDWTGAPTNAALGTGWIEYLHPDDHDPVLAAWSEALQRGTPLQLEYRLRTAAGTYRWCHVRTRRREDCGHADAIWYGTLEDVHERRTAQEALQRTQAEQVNVARLSAMGTMATAIAHDLNQPLTAAAHYLRGCRRMLAETGKVDPDIDEGLDGADRNIIRASDIVRRVREFVARGTVERAPEWLSPLIDEACDFALGDAAAHGITHCARLEPGLRVLVNRVQIQQVLINLLRNAADALQDQPRREITISARRCSGDLALVSVMDSGGGVADEIRDRLFDPFVTTSKGGMGVGLSISRTIVEAHGGTIWHEAGPRRGTVASFTLPLV
jgi:two-component system, LuxR family, sensor kinase FixL